MSTTPKHTEGWLSFFPRGGRGLIGLIAAFVVVFLLGLVFSGGGDDNPAPPTAGADAVAVSADQTAPVDTLWTCSMHPQIRLHKPGKCPICFMDLIPLIPSTGASLPPDQLQMSEDAKKLAQIETTPVRRAFAEAQIRMVGKLAYDETRLAYITAWVPGRLDRLYADYTGVRVNKGDQMVSLYSPQLISAQEELRQAKRAMATLSNGSDVLRSTAEATVDAAREKLRLYGLSRNQIADIESADTTRDHLTIYAPAGGTVVEKQATEGMYVQTGTRIYTIADLSKLWVMFDAYESDLPWLRNGQQVSFTSASFPGRTFTAVITFIDPTINNQTRTAKVRAIVDNAGGLLKPDMFVSGVVDSRLDGAGRVTDVHPAGKAPLIIPASAPLITGTRAVVYVEVSDGDDGPIYEGREIELGPRAGDVYVVESGLAEGEKVVTHGAFKIDSELQIQAKPSMMSLASETPTTATAEPIQAVATPDSTGLSDKARAALTPIYNNYFDLQMALAKDDLDSAQAANGRIADAIGGVDTELFHGDDHMKWLMLSGRAKDYAKAGIDTPDLDSARAIFEDLSTVVIDLQESFGHADDVAYYLTYCPMAFNNKGAYWLQTEKIVWNSFFGSKMLRCGSIKDTLPGAGKAGI